MKKKRFVILVLVIGIIIALLYSANWTKRFFQIDACLDSGGRWNYEQNKCDYKTIRNDIFVRHYELRFDTITMVEAIVLNKRIESIDDSIYEFYHHPEYESEIQYVVGNTKNNYQSIRFGNNTCEFISSKLYYLDGEEIEVMKFNLDNENSDRKEHIYYISEIGLLAIYYYIWDMVDFLEYEETKGLRELMFVDDTDFFISSINN